jgi:ATP-dependent protease Clp ATPase subunit
LERPLHVRLAKVQSVIELPLLLFLFCLQVIESIFALVRLCWVEWNLRSWYQVKISERNSTNSQRDYCCVRCKGSWPSKCKTSSRSGCLQPLPDGKQNVLLAGSTGSGKTFFVKTLVDFLEVPIVFVSAGNLTAEGYKGENIGDVLHKIDSSLPDQFKRRRAIVLLDEFDKLGNGYNIEYKREVQQNLLTVLEGNFLSTGTDGSAKRSYNIDTYSLLFIMTGTFQGIEEIISDSIGTKKFGFNAINSTDPTLGNLPTRELTASDLITFGFIPEIIGRIAKNASLDALDENDLATILWHAPNSVIK